MIVDNGLHRLIYKVTVTLRQVPKSKEYKFDSHQRFLVYFQSVLLTNGHRIIVVIKSN